MSLHEPISRLDDWFVGEDKDIEYTVYQDNEVDLQDITGWTIQFRMATSISGVSVLTRNAVLDSPAGGICIVQTAAADTNSLAPRKYFYTLSRIDSGFNAVIADGPCFLQARVA